MAQADNRNRRAALDSFEAELRRMRPRDEPAALAQRPLDNIAFHDFAFYEFILPTEAGFGGPADRGLSDFGLAYLDGLEARGVPDGLLGLLAEFLVELEGAIRSAVNIVVGSSRSEDFFKECLWMLYNDTPHLITELFEIYTEVPRLRRMFISELTTSFVEEMNLAFGVGYPFSWATWRSHAIQEQFTVSTESSWEPSTIVQTHREVLTEWMEMRALRTCHASRSSTRSRSSRH
jgi:hypothetical protein